MTYPTPHGKKLTAAIANKKLPANDIPRLKAAIVKYEQWLKDLDAVTGTPEECISKMVTLFNDYKFYIDFDLIFCSEDDFLYRQKGQLKLDNTIIEEFLPRFICEKTVPELTGHGFSVGPTTAYSSISFESSIYEQPVGGGMKIKPKDQDFAIAKKLYIKSSHDVGFNESITAETYLAYVAAECKTNLDKTMFQEAAATAHNVKTAVIGAKYFLLAEWLDMTPVSSATTDIDEVLVLRKAKRLGSGVRSNFSSSAGRKKEKDNFEAFLKNNPHDVNVYARLCSHIKALFPKTENETLVKGYF